MSKNRQTTMTRRSLVANSLTIAAGASIANLSGATQTLAQNQPEAAKVKTYANSDFYDDHGKFLVEKAREAYYDMFRRFHYPISDTLKKEMWVLDFNLGDFAQVGMAGIFWLNRQDHNYFGHEIYLLPGQMIPEHAHFPTAKGGAKMESWQPRRGMIYTFGEGEVTPDLLGKIPRSQRDLVKSRHCNPLEIDQIGHLNRLEAFHFMVAGPEGALVTEYGTFHDMDGLRFSNPKAKV